jgi:predicted transcriptional regulator
MPRITLTMTSFSQSPRDHLLWILANNGGKMERSRLRAATGMRYALLNSILDELMKEGRIRITVTMKRDIVSLISR